jgi:hypothetical protein
MSITGGPATNSGGDIAVRTGTLSLPNGSPLKVSGTEITHSNPIPMASGTVNYSFQYTAPSSPGVDSLYGIGLSGNGDNNNSSADQWNWAPTTAITITATAPAAPLLSTPLDTASSQPITFSLSWQASTNATTYRVQIAADAGFSSLILDDSTVSTTTRATPTLSYSTKYYWRVNAKNSGGTSAWSTVRSFTTLAQVAGVPTLVSPPNGAVNQATAFAFVWNKVNTGTGYAIQVASDTAFSTLIVNDSTLVDSTRQVGSLANASTYYWRVASMNGSTRGPWSVRWSLTTIVAPPGVPTLVSPADLAVSQPVAITLKWNKTAGATGYGVQVSADTLFGSFVVNDSTLVDTTRLVSGLAYNTKYFWRANALNVGGKGGFSSTRAFTTILIVPITGKKTVGGTSPDYPTLKLALKDLAVRGTAAPGVTFAIRGGTYKEDTLIVSTTTSGPTAPITIKPDSLATVVINDSASAALPFVIKIDSTSYVTIDGSNNGTTSRDMTIRGLSANAQKGVWVSSLSTNVTVKNLFVYAGAATSASYIAVDFRAGSTAGANPHYGLVENCVLRNGYTGVRVQGRAVGDSVIGPVVRRNLIDSVSNAGVYVSGNSSRLEVSSNDISIVIPGSTGAMSGVQVGNGSTFARIFNNKIHDIVNLTTSSATYVIDMFITSGLYGKNAIFNNMIWGLRGTGTGTYYGIYVNAANSSVPDTIAYNSVNLTDSTASNRTSYAFYRGSTIGSALVVNNIFVNTRTDGITGIAYAVGKTSAAAVVSSDHNDLYVGTDTTRRKIAIAGTVYAQLPSWVAATAGDSASVSALPPFVSPSDLHIQTSNPTPLNGGGTPVAGITKDFDGNTRDVSKPDIGAHEFQVLTALAASQAVPGTFRLEQNYPNPFNPTTKISYTVPSTVGRNPYAEGASQEVGLLLSASRVRLTVYDLLGREVAVLVDGVQSPGRHEMTFDASRLTSGVYFYRLQAGEYTATRRMLLLK